MKNLKLLSIIFFLVIGATKVNAQQHFGNITNFEILPAYLSNGKVLLSNTSNTTPVQFKVWFNRISSTYPNWKPFKMSVVLGSYKIDDYGSITGVDYFSTPVEVKSSDFPTNPNVAFLDKTFSATIDKTVLTNPNRKIILFYKTADMTGYSYFNVMYNFIINSGSGPGNPTNPTNPTDPTTPIGPIGSSGTLATMAGIDIGADDGVYFWGRNGKVTKGNSTSINGPTADYILPAGRDYSQIIDIAISNSGYVYVWYNDGIMSVGHTTNLGDYIAPKNYTLPDGKTPADLVGISILKGNDHIYAFYTDGTFTEGNSTDLAAYASFKPYAVPPGKNFSDITDIGIATSSSAFYAWYTDEKMSVGYDASNLNSFIPLKPMN